MSIAQSAMPCIAAAQVPRKIGGRIEDFLVGLIFFGPILGTFNPFEGYVDQTSFDIATQSANREFPVTTQISHATLLITAYLVLKYWSRIISDLRYSIPFITLYALYFVNIFFSEEPATTLRLCYHYLEILALTIYICLRYDAEDLLKFLTRVLTIGAVLSIICVVALPKYGLTTNLFGYANTWRGAYNSKNALGCIAGLGTIATGYTLATKSDKRLLHLGLFFLNVLLLVMSRSMTSLLSTAICGMIGCLVFWRKSVFGWIAIVTSTLTGLFAVVAVFANATSATDALGRSGTLTGRTDVWHIAIDYISKRPFTGYGLGFWGFTTRSKQNAWATLGWAAPHAHNDFLDVTLQVGAAATLIIITIYLIGIYNGSQLALRKIDANTVFFLWVIYFFVRSFTETFSVSPGSNLVALLVISVVQLKKSSVRLNRTYSSLGSDDTQSPHHGFVYPILKR